MRGRSLVHTGYTAQMAVSVWHTLLDLLFPGSSRAQRVRTFTPDQLPITPHSHTVAGRSVISLLPYDEPRVRDCIWALKYERSVPAAQVLAAVLTDWLLETAAENALFAPQSLIVVPLPLAQARRRERGYNQVELLVQQLPVSDAYQVRTDTLVRVRETRPQTRLPRAERLRNVADAFAAVPGTDLRGTHVLLIDDVTTTGATLTHAARALECAGASVTALALARSG